MKKKKKSCRCLETRFPFKDSLEQKLLWLAISLLWIIALLSPSTSSSGSRILITSPTRVLILSLIARLALETLIVGSVVSSGVRCCCCRRCFRFTGFCRVVSRANQKLDNRLLSKIYLETQIIYLASVGAFVALACCCAI